jgi:hypothetical protein
MLFKEGAMPANESELAVFVALERAKIADASIQWRPSR